jgi:hypothetical protein
MKYRIEYVTAVQTVLLLFLIDSSLGFTSKFVMTTVRESRLIHDSGWNGKQQQRSGTTGCSTRIKRMSTVLLLKNHANDDENPMMIESRQKTFINSNKVDNYIVSSTVDYYNRNDRRKFIKTGILSTIAAIGLFVSDQDQVNAYYVKSFPLELQSFDGQQQPDTRIRKVNEIITKEQKQVQETKFITSNKITSSLLWGNALWFLSGSRSNPVVTPLANIIYKKDTEIWLQERNDGFFAALPWEFLIILGIVFIGLGYIFDTIVVAITAASLSDVNTAAATGIDLSSILSTTTAISIQLACVTIIGSGALELGRIASGDKGQTKDENIRSNQLQDEFIIFVTDRLIIYEKSKTKNVHKSEIIAAFRRYYSKYRVRPEDQITTTQIIQQNDLQQQQQLNDNVSDLEIERLLRSWAKNQDGIDMTSAGFFYGVGINRDADIFVTR